MLVTENQMNEADAHYIDCLELGLAFQLFGGLTRLGKKVVTLKSDASSELEKYPIFFADSIQATAIIENNLNTAIFCAEPFLSHNEAPSEAYLDESIKKATKLLNNNPQAQFIFILPKNTTQNQIEKIRTNIKDATVFLSPAIFGFKDQNLMDKLLEQHEKTFQNWKTYNADCDLLFSADAAGFVISTVGRHDLKGKTIELPTSTTNLEELVSSYCKAFNFNNTGLIAKIGAKLIPTLDFNLKKTSESPSTNTLKALDVFPSAIHSVERAMKECKRLYEQNPAQQLHFPPSKSL